MPCRCGSEGAEAGGKKEGKKRGDASEVMDSRRGMSENAPTSESTSEW